MPGSNMGKSVLLYDGSSGQQQLNSLSSSKQSGEDTILNMDLMQKQQLQQRLIINEDVRTKIKTILRVNFLNLFFNLLRTLICVTEQTQCKQ
jgi:hypothetical protein